MYCVINVNNFICDNLLDSMRSILGLSFYRITYNGQASIIFIQARNDPTYYNQKTLLPSKETRYAITILLIVSILS